MNRMHALAAITLAAGFLATPAMAGYTITQGASAPTYSTVLNFDEVGGPTGIVSPAAWQTSHGITELQAGDGQPVVADHATPSGQPWLGTDNSFFGNFGVFLTLDTAVTEMSFQALDPSGPPSFFGGGLGIFLFNDGDGSGNDYVHFDIFTPAWGGVGDEWFNITTDSGMVFDEVRILGFGFGPTTYADDISWNSVPEPGSLALLGLAGAFVARRRKN
jgi:hypothetical protein